MNGLFQWCFLAIKITVLHLNRDLQKVKEKNSNNKKAEPSRQRIFCAGNPEPSYTSYFSLIPSPERRSYQ